MRYVLRLFILVVAVLLAGMWMSSAPGWTAPPQASVAVIHHYDGHAGSAGFIHVISQRGPPLYQYDRPPVDGAVDRWSHGALACPDGLTLAAAIADHPTELVQGERAMGTTWEEVAGDDGALSAFDRAGVATDTVGTTTARLQRHVSQAVADYESGAISMSARQARAAERNPNLRATYRGQVIDRGVKNSVRNDPELSHLWVSRSGEFGPDFHDIGTGTWWDVTTPQQWGSHVDQYSDPFGWGIGLFTR